jgi:hypothetical protein
MKKIEFHGVVAAQGLTTRCALAVVALSMLLVLSGQAWASVLTFDIFDPAYAGTENFPEGFQVAQEYGDRVTSLSTMNGTTTFEYGVGAEGFTPNVEVSYDPSSIFTGGPSLWRYDYGDLVRVLYQGSTFTGFGNDYDYLTIRFQADPSYDAVLYGFDLGGWFQTDYVIDGVAVYDGEFNGFFPELNRVFFDEDATVLGAGPSHTSYSFGTPLQGNVITILIDANNLGPDSELIGIDNIRFGQAQSTNGVVPEAASLVVWLVGGGSPRWSGSGVDGADLAFWKAGFGTAAGAEHMDGDADFDGDADGADFLTWQRQLGNGPAVAAVPEPATVWLLAMAAACAARRGARTARA